MDNRSSEDNHVLAYRTSPAEVIGAGRFVWACALLTAAAAANLCMIVGAALLRDAPAMTTLHGLLIAFYVVPRYAVNPLLIFVATILLLAGAPWGGPRRSAWRWSFAAVAGALLLLRLAAGVCLEQTFEAVFSSGTSGTDLQYAALAFDLLAAVPLLALILGALALVRAGRNRGRGLVVFGTVALGLTALETLGLAILAAFQAHDAAHVPDWLTICVWILFPLSEAAQMAFWPALAVVVWRGRSRA